MTEKLQKKYALSEKGAKDLIIGVTACMVQNMVLMLPVSLIYLFVRDLLNGKMSEEKIPFYIGGILIIFVIIFMVTYWQYNSTFLATYVETGKRRITLAEKLRKIPLSFFGERDLADLTSTIMGDCTYLETAFSHFIPQFAGAMFSTIVIAFSLLIFNAYMAIASLWVLPVAIAIVALSSGVQHRLSEKSMEARINCADGIQECIEAVQVLKANNAEAQYMEGLDKKIEAVEKRAVISELGTSVFVVSAQMILKLGIATTALMGAKLLIAGQLDVITFFVYLLVVSRLYDPMQSSLQNLAAIISTKTNVKRMNEILYCDVQEGTDELINNGYDICFDNVKFSYNDNETVLNGISFTAKQGEVTALVGTSGGGKTTVSKLAARFWDVDSGRITVGGMDISKIEPDKLLTLYSIVFQDVVLFNTSVMENIRLGRRNATDEEVLKAAKYANCDDFVLKLEKGYDTEIGENGCKLSGGERQRISIARAFLKNAPIILLDEATASLDVENETLVQTALSRLIKDKTVLVIAHRMRTVLGADKIVVLVDGKVVEQGKPKELVNNNGVYSKMVENQLKGQNWKI